MIKYKIENKKLEPFKYDRTVSGVYVIECIINNKKYIGATNRLKYRLSQHKRELEKDNHHNKTLQEDWNRYGEDGFRFYVLEYCKYKLFDKETRYNAQIPEEQRYSHANHNVGKHKPPLTRGSFSRVDDLSCVQIDKEDFGRVWRREFIGAKWIRTDEISKIIPGDLPGTKRYDIRITEKITHGKRKSKRKSK